MSIASFVQLNYLNRSTAYLYSTNSDYYVFSSVLSVSSGILAINSGVSPEYSLFTSEIGGPPTFYTNNAYVIGTPGIGAYSVVPAMQSN